MRPTELKAARQAAGWSQHEVAARLGVSQPYYSQLENGARPLPAGLHITAVQKLKLAPTALPLPELSLSVIPCPPDELGAALARLGYPGFGHMPKARKAVNPAELVARALSNSDLEPRLTEALPWVLVSFPDLDWMWLAGQCRLLNLQNRLGFLVALARESRKPDPSHLQKALSDLEQSRLVSEGTMCRDSMPAAERIWVRKHRSALAAHWNLLTTLTSDQLTHAK